VLHCADFVALAVCDDGIPEAVLERVFEPFFARQPGGDVRIESAPGAGTRVALYLPRAVEATHDAEGKNEELAPGSGHVLVVDDDLDVREASLTTLTHLGCRVTVAENGPEAIAKLRLDATTDVLFSDLVMAAGMSGIDFAQVARNARPELKILLTTGYADVVMPSPN
jgi:hypothetical protein